ncbi:armadillo-type protein [Dimargaris cristalligena]|uniref:Armadillo-type protein n=1 Tax=Dimargaris cristalligena TaxID=215637 RepID=A0A4P9ZX75_9FUNG|nr:armadillo-type protein [Dimargaris cristalligena]|eukprot:RKP38243.1 armadillo-type protein [Dimargaris cristalligena]
MATLDRLRFRQKLVFEGTKTIAPAELMKRLKTLHAELAEMDQEKVDVRSLDSVTRSLISSTLLEHKDNGVQIHTACCLADIMRLYAPEAPYDEEELRTIFEFFLSQLAHLAQSNSDYFQLYFYLLESLSNVKSVVLVVDLNHPEQLVTEFFRLFFDIIRPDQSRNLQLYMVDVLHQLVEETPTVPQEVVDIILAQFLKKRQTANPTAYQLACDLCNAATDRLQKYICQYFTDVIVNAGKASSGSTSGSSGDPHFTADQLSEFKTAHYLIKELNRACPGLLLNVIPQLEEELTLDAVQLRTLATSVLGDMIAERGHALVRRYPTAWKAWIQRKADKNHAVRALWVELAIHLYRAQPQLGRELNEAIHAKVTDPDEKVRLAVARGLAQLDLDTLTYSPLDPEILVQLGHRCRDKKSSPRQEAIKALSHIFDLAYPSLETRDPIAVARFGWIPSVLFNTFYANDLDTLVMVERALTETVFQPSATLTDEQRTRRLLIVVALLDDRARKAFMGFLNRQLNTSREMNLFLDLCEKYNAAEDPQGADGQGVLNNLNYVIRLITSKLPDARKHADHLLSFAKMHDVRLHKMIRDAMSPQLGHKAIRKSQREAVKRLESLSPTLADTFTILIRRVSLTVVNRSTITETAGTGAAGSDTASAAQWTPAKLAETAHILLKHIATVFPEMYKSHVTELFALVRNDSATAGDDDTEQGQTASLKTVADFAKAFPTEVPTDRAIIQRLVQIALSDSVAPVAAKYAASVLAHADSPAATAAVTQILDQLVPNLAPIGSDADAEVLRPCWAHLKVLGQFALFRSGQFAPYTDRVVSFVQQNFLRAELTTTANATPTVATPAATPVRPSRQRSRTVATSAAAIDRANAALPVLKLLDSWITPVPTTTSAADAPTDPEPVSTPNPVRSFRRLTAAQCLLKLATQDRYESLLGSQHVERLSGVVQDPCYPVRLSYTTKLIGYLNSLRIPHRFLASLFLVAPDTEAAIKLTVRSFVKRQLQAPNMRDRFATLYETTITRLIHLLAHRPDYDETSAALNALSRYIDFYLDLVANDDNVSLIFHMAAQLKTVTDRSTMPPNPTSAAQTLKASQPIYVLSDMAQYLIQEKCHAHQWTLLSYPGSDRPPRDLFVPIENDEVLSQIAKRSFLPPDFTRDRSGVSHNHHYHHSSGGTGGGASATPRRGAGTGPGLRGEVTRQRKSASRTAAAAGSESEASGSDGEGDSDAETGRRKRRRPRRRPSDASERGFGRSKMARAAEGMTTPSRRNAPRRAKADGEVRYHQSSDSDSNVEED